MAAPTIVSRADHRISRRDIDPEALKVLYRLHEHHYTVYLVGGSVRDLLLGRRPKDFDIGTDAHPYQIKKLFRNCWIIGRRFRLAHIKFGPKTIEVATFRRLVPDVPDAPVDDEPVVVASSPEPEPDLVEESAGATPRRPRAEGQLHHDNTFGTPEEDAFRRDFTINGLFYDIGTFSVIDYVGGLEDLEKRVVRSIGDPRVRFVEDPVRMLRAVVMAARLGFDLDPLVVDAIAEHRGLIAKASPARLLEEYYKILRSGSAEATFRGLAETRLLELITPELKSPPLALWQSLARLDRFRLRTPGAPPELTNTLLIGSLLVPIGALEPRPTRGRRDEQTERVSFGALPVARRDLDQLHHMMQILPRLADPELPDRVARTIVGRPAFPDALVWLDLLGDSGDLVEEWREAYQARVEEDAARGPRPRHRDGGRAQDQDPGPVTGTAGTAGVGEAPRRRRRRRRRRGPGGPPPQTG